MDADRAKQLTKLAKKKHLRDIETIYASDLNAMVRELDDKIYEAAKSGTNKYIMGSIGFDEFIKKYITNEQALQIDPTLWSKALQDHYSARGFKVYGNADIVIEWSDDD